VVVSSKGAALTDNPEDQWKQKLTKEQYHVLREKGTEAPGTGKYTDLYDDGMYHCAACGSALFSSETKYESTVPGLVGWPSFAEAAANDAIELHDDNSMGMQRTEVTCKNCGSHLGHLFPDDSSPNGKHYCINSVSLDFKPAE
jgi:peptide-methionine (R)-S-oxide reductase